MIVAKESFLIFATTDDLDSLLTIQESDALKTALATHAGRNSQQIFRLKSSI